MNIIELTPREILVSSIVDGMNRYVNQVLVPADLVAEADWDQAAKGTGSDLCTKKYAIAEDIAAKWEKALQERIKRHSQAPNKALQRTEQGRSVLSRLQTFLSALFRR